MFVKSPIKQQTYESEELLHQAMSQSSSHSKKMKSISSDVDSVGESDSSTTISVKGSGNTGQRVFRWSKFVRNLYEMAINPMNGRAVGFSTDGLCLEVRDAKLLSSDVLQKYFKHKNVSSFIRQLNNYGFKTVPVVMNSTVSHCFAHDCFQQDRLDLLEGVTRRTAGSDAQKIGERISALREKESEFEERMEQLQRHNEELKRHNSELMEENKRLRSSWMAVQDTLKSRLYEQQPPSQHQHQQQHVQQQYQQQQPRGHRGMPPPPTQSNEQTMGFGFEPSSQEIFMFPTFPALFPEEF